MRHLRNPAGDTLGMVGLLGALGAAGFVGYHYLTDKSTPVPAATTPDPAAKYNIPSDLGNLMNMQFQRAGNGALWNPTIWIRAMQSVYPAGGQVWGYVYQQWSNAYSQTGGTYPSNDQDVRWLTFALENFD